jgi:hypothetical protein
MNDVSVDTDVRARARKRVEDIKGFYVHVGVYVIVNAALLAINLLSSPDTLWFYWPLLGWGIGVAIHAFTLILEGGILGSDWEERKIDELVQREEHRVHHQT